MRQQLSTPISTIRQQKSVNVLRYKLNPDEGKMSPSKNLNQSQSQNHIRTPSKPPQQNNQQGTNASYKSVVDKTNYANFPQQKQYELPIAQSVYHKGGSQIRKATKFSNNNKQIQLSPQKLQQSLQQDVQQQIAMAKFSPQTRSSKLIVKLLYDKSDDKLPKLSPIKARHIEEKEEVAQFHFNEEPSLRRASPLKQMNTDKHRLTVMSIGIIPSIPTSSQPGNTSLVQQTQTQTKIPTQQAQKSEANIIGYKTQPGKNPDKTTKTNQDTYFFLENYGSKPGNGLFSVCDGHGVEGHKVSQYLREVLPINISSSLNSCATTQQYKDCLTNAFKLSNQSLNEGSGIDCTFSGSTCILTLMIGKTLYTANVGDSRCVVGKIISSAPNQIQANPLSFDHKPDNPKEQKRIEKSGGRVQPYLDYDGSPLGPSRVWKKDQDLPGLAMSRSFGDRVAAQCGVIAVPEITVHVLTEEDRFIVLASDGVWEFLSNQQVVEMVYPYYKNNQADLASQKLVKESTTLWKQNDEVIDDITCLVIFLKR